MKVREFEVAKVDEKNERKLLGVFGIFLKGKKREDFSTSRLVSLTIKKYKKSGVDIPKEDLKKVKFAYDPIYKQRVIDRVHKECDKKYQKNIQMCEKNIRSIENARDCEIKRIEASRWKSIANGILKYNYVEGVALINNNKVPFSSIKGAYLNTASSFRVETIGHGKSKKHASIGGAVVGGIAFGAVGALVGGATLGKTTHKMRSNSNSIPTSNHVGVIVDIDGFETEILLLNNLVDQNSVKYKTAIAHAEIVISKLRELSSIPVPESFFKADEEQSVLEFDKQLEEANDILLKARADIPTYEIPAQYIES